MENQAVKTPEPEASQGERTLSGVPSLGWGRGKECTFAGALEAALSVTHHPYSYAELMGYSGLAFRVRWFKPPRGRGWCPSCAVGEMDEEIDAVARATGWPLRCVVHCDTPRPQSLIPDIVASIDAGKPVLTYGETLNMAVIYGYREGGHTLKLRDYLKGDAVQELPATRLGWLQIFLVDYERRTTWREAALTGLRIAVHNWWRQTSHAGPDEYWYGGAAVAAWAHDIDMADSLSEEERAKLLCVSWWNFTSLVDARQAAVAFLREHAPRLGDPLQGSLERTAGLYQQEAAYLSEPVFEKKEAFLGPWSGKGIADWTVEVRRRECELLSEVRALESAAIAELEKAIS